MTTCVWKHLFAPFGHKKTLINIKPFPFSWWLYHLNRTSFFLFLAVLAIVCHHKVIILTTFYFKTLLHFVGKSVLYFPLSCRHLDLTVKQDVWITFFPRPTRYHQPASSRLFPHPERLLHIYISRALWKSSEINCLWKGMFDQLPVHKAEKRTLTLLPNNQVTVNVNWYNVVYIG